MSTLFAILSKQSYQDLYCLPFLAFWSVSTLLAIPCNLIRVYTICNSKSDKGLHYLRFSPVSSVSTPFAILSKQYYQVFSVFYSQKSNQGLHCLPFSAVWSGSTLFAFLSLISIYTIFCFQQSDQGLHYLPFFLCSMIKDYTVCHSQNSNQGLHYLPFSAVWSRSRATLSFSGTIWSGSTLFAILSSLVRDYTICHSQQSDQGQGPHCHSQEQPGQGLHYLSFSKVWSGSSLFAIFSSLISVYTVCHSQQSNQGLYCLPFSAFWSGSTLFAILSTLIKVYTVCHSQQCDEGLHYLPFLAVWSGSTLFTILRLIMDYTIFHSLDKGIHYLQFFLSSINKVYTVCNSQQSD